MRPWPSCSSSGQTSAGRAVWAVARHCTTWHPLATPRMISGQVSNSPAFQPLLFSSTVQYLFFFEVNQKAHCIFWQFELEGVIFRSLPQVCCPIGRPESRREPILSARGRDENHGIDVPSLQLLSAQTWHHGEICTRYQCHSFGMVCHL